MIKDNKLDLSSKNRDEIKKYLEAILASRFHLRKKGMRISLRSSSHTKQNNCG